MTLDLLTHISIFFSKTVRLVATSLRLLQSIVSGPRTHTHTHSRTKFDAVWRVEVRERVSQRERERELESKPRPATHLLWGQRTERESERERWRWERGRTRTREKGACSASVAPLVSLLSHSLSLALSNAHSLSRSTQSNVWSKLADLMRTCVASSAKPQRQRPPNSEQKPPSFQSRPFVKQNSELVDFFQLHRTILATSSQPVDQPEVQNFGRVRSIKRGTWRISKSG